MVVVVVVMVMMITVNGHWMDGVYGGDRAKKLVDRQMCKCKEVTLLPRGRIEVNLTAHRA